MTPAVSSPPELVGVTVEASATSNPQTASDQDKKENNGEKEIAVSVGVVKSTISSSSLADVVLTTRKESVSESEKDESPRRRRSSGGRKSFDNKLMVRMPTMKRSEISDKVSEKLSSIGFGKDCPKKNPAWLKLKMMMHEVWEDTADSYNPVDDILCDRSLSSDELQRCGSLFLEVSDEIDEDDDGVDPFLSPKGKKETFAGQNKELLSKLELGDDKLDDLKVELSEQPNHDEENDRAPLFSPTGGNFGLKANPWLSRTPSMQQLLEEKDEVLTGVCRGEIVSELPSGEEGIVDIRNQVNLDSYSVTNLELRRSVLHDDTFRAVSRQIFDMLANVEHKEIPKQSYMIFCLKVCIVATPPPIDLEATAKSSLEDWDVVAAGKDSMGWDAFFLQLFQLCDMWVTTCLADDYTNFLLRLIAEITVSEGGKLCFKKDEAIHFNRYFNFLFEAEANKKGHVEEKEEDAEVNEDISGEKIKKDEKRHSVLTRDLTRHVIDVEGENQAAKMKTMTLSETTLMIAKIYASKIAADNYLHERLKADKNAKGDRFDAFVMHMFRGLHPTRQAARRHMRVFLRSVRHFCTEHTRVEMFRRVCGIPDKDHNPIEFIPGLVNKFVIPTIRNCFRKDTGEAAKPTEVFNLMSTGIPEPCTIDLVKLKRAIKPQFLFMGAFSGGALTSYVKEVKSLYSVILDGMRFAGSFVDVDKCLLHSYGIFLFANKMEGFVKLRSIRVLQQWVRDGMPSYSPKGEEEMNATTTTTCESDVVTSNNLSPDNKLSSPRKALEEARQLDTAINGGGTEDVDN